ncbi:uncharacterized protein A1O5_07904 [Cladophialophora psammophila CBS 110553]|uniref:Heterokaryon incompatibility domain-containing protein n=1 Tax=Cladophialophora psammophila CBS 110553 TaxID=1182543 RepID=W9XF17_9EURO|nr:uncharacterized protein A1O5_07904 [Cladophialophora psammophila CBS 110553]EXJ68969.1 hypothetical protein A1O5_07904 [Cladophialophora psammophila CBS 110553]
MEHNHPQDPLIDLDQGVQFNGIGEDGHETFLLRKENITSFDFCKTVQKPYDLTVCLVLLRARQLAGDAFSLRSDGSWNEGGWRKAHNLYKLLWPEDVLSCPWRVRSEPDLLAEEETPSELTDGISNMTNVDAKETNLIQGQGRRQDFSDVGKVIRNLLSSCISDPTHRKCAQNELRWQSLPGVTLRLIDVFLGCIVDAPEGCSFLALSYVWGKTRISGLRDETMQWFTQNGSLSRAKNIPRVISEAIQLCGAIGERYLWVDALCIKQDDTRDKAIQILRMRQIFGSAKLTIVAAAGQDANSPLFASNPPGNRELSSNGIYKNSIWTTRGWTFQEAALSHRMLVFSTLGLYFECQDQLWNIDESSLETTALPKGENEWDFLYAPSGSELHAYYSAVEGYSKRNLTYQSDVLNAFQGIMKTFSATLDGQNNEFYFGLPTSLFDQAICWQTDQHCPHLRRPKYPSWSWLGWKQRIFWKSQPDVQTRSAQMLYQPVNKRKRLLFAQLGADGSSPLFTHQYSNRRPCYFQGQDLEDGEWAWGLPAALSIYSRGTSSLCLMSSLAQLMVSRVDLARTEEPNGLYSVMADSPNREVLGTVKLDRGWRNDQPDSMPFMALDGEEGDGTLVLTILMCLSNSHNDSDSREYSRVQMMECQIGEETWKKAGALLRLIWLI